MYKNEIFYPSDQGSYFYGIMGKYFADKSIIKEMDNQLYNNENTTWILNIDINNESVRGFISIQDKGNHYYIDNFYVLPIFRGLSIGKPLLKKAIELHNLKPIKLITRNDIAYNAFLECGFEEVRKNGRYTYMIKENGR